MREIFDFALDSQSLWGSGRRGEIQRKAGPEAPFKRDVRECGKRCKKRERGEEMNEWVEGRGKSKGM